MRRSLPVLLALAVLAPPALAQEQGKDNELPRLGLDPAEPQVRSAPPATPFAIPPATSKEFVLDFHGYLLMPLQVGVHDRKAPMSAESGTVLHTPPLVPQQYRRFQYTGVVPDPWVQLNLTYGNRLVAGTMIIAATAASQGEAFYDPLRQAGVSSAYLTFNLEDVLKTPLQVRAGALVNRYGAMGAFDSGRYATPLIARVNAVGETTTAGFKVGSATFVVEQGIGGQLGRPPTGLTSAGWNDFADPNTGASFVNHVHAGFDYAGAFQLGLHYVTAFTQDDRTLDGSLPNGRITVIGADARVMGRLGHLYLGGAHTTATNAAPVASVIEVLNARGGRELIEEYLGPASEGDGGLTTFGAQYDLSLSRAFFGEQFRGQNPDVLFSLFGIGTAVESDDPDFDGVLKLKAGSQVTYNMLSWFGATARYDHVRLDLDENHRAFSIWTGGLLFHSGWQSRDEIALRYSRFVYGREVNVARGFPPVDDPSVSPDEHVLSLSATFWW